MKAAVFHGKENITIEEIPYPTLQDDGIIVKVRSSGICGSDLHLYSHGGMDGTVMGHEFSGDVIEVGPKVKGISIGDRVVAVGGNGCGECYWCRRGDYIKCSKLSFMGYGIKGAFAEYTAVPNAEPGKYVEKIPDHISYDVAATSEPLSVALYAVNQVNPKPDDICVVTGLGIIGICVVQILRSRGIKHIIASGRRSKRLELAKQSGAEVVVDAAKDNVMPVVEQIAGSKKADVVFEVAGVPELFEQALQMVHRGGVIDLVGLYQEPVTWNPAFIVGNDITIIGCGLKWDLPGALQLLADGSVDTKDMITHVYPLEKTKEAFDTQLTSQDAVKVIVQP
ncbi:MAG: alcohol dehydrogenase catalytic domain-containing protein [Dehalococcoidales bacterium]|nr:alcohol dehydrogenase catalytic domain-containing protein [Dehalococcoidales bacterium]